MGHYCRICTCSRANEKFSGKGHRRHICVDCQKLSASERALMQIPDQLGGYLRQSHINEGTCIRMRKMLALPDPAIVTMVELVLEVARLTPFKRKRVGKLKAGHPAFFRRLLDSDLDLPEHYWESDEPWDFEDSEPAAATGPTLDTEPDKDIDIPF